ncbi:GPI biosynthesis protein family Pig-F-domain-containing protein [Dichomitus squalens]|uniref:GPI biosynthesis protein family Pig-F-domain-containing protein n=1 Tax=Dichomitus squalens TaxID=114155 RepID=A0A4Q9MEL9_9APHY|nr:GPI biosynthesis protein family Pig-F-domain-containing protein [Dichomitus squalens]
MPSRKGKGKAAEAPPPRTQIRPEHPSQPTYFPFARYTSVVGVHTSLLAFTALLLPATTPSLGGVLARWDFTSRTEDRDIMQVLTENPLRTLAWICTGALILQCWWAGWVKEWSLTARARKVDNAEAAKQKMERDGWEAQRERVVAYGKAVGTTLVASFAYHVVAVLFGAPVTSHTLQTYSTALLLSILTVLPPAYALGPPSFGSDSPSLVSRLTWVRLYAELSPRTAVERALVYPAIGTVTGAWLGAVPIGLDWERPWQAWPLTPTFGAIAGFIVGSLIALLVSATLELAQADRQRRQAADEVKAS